MGRCSVSESPIGCILPWCWAATWVSSMLPKGVPNYASLWAVRYIVRSYPSAWMFPWSLPATKPGHGLSGAVLLCTAPPQSQSQSPSPLLHSKRASGPITCIACVHTLQVHPADGRELGRHRILPQLRHGGGRVADAAAAVRGVQAGVPGQDPDRRHEAGPVRHQLSPAHAQQVRSAVVHHFLRVPVMCKPAPALCARSLCSRMSWAVYRHVDHLHGHV